MFRKSTQGSSDSQALLEFCLNTMVVSAFLIALVYNLKMFTQKNKLTDVEDKYLHRFYEGVEIKNIHSVKSNSESVIWNRELTLSSGELRYVSLKCESVSLKRAQQPLKSDCELSEIEVNINELN